MAGPLPHLLLIPGTSSLAHLEQNLEAAARLLELEELDRIGGSGSLDPDR